MTNIPIQWIYQTKNYLPRISCACRYLQKLCKDQSKYHVVWTKIVDPIDIEYLLQFRKENYGNALFDDNQWLEQVRTPIPTVCSACGLELSKLQGHEYNLFFDRAYTNGKDWTGALSDAPIGSVWDAFWFRDTPHLCGPDGRSLVAKCPGGKDWMIDSRARNCTLPEDKSHRCWVRHGKPEDGTLHVDKNGLTCSAGAGSIDTGSWHGFLHNGHFTS